MSQRDFDYNRGFTAGEGERTTLQSKIDALQALLTAADERADEDDMVLRSSVPERHKGCTSPVGAVQSYIVELEGRADALEGLLCNASAWIKRNSCHGTDAIELWERIDAALKPAEPKEGPHLILDICGMPIHACEFMAALGITYQLAVPQSMSDTWWFFNCENVRSSRPSRLRVLDKTAQQCVGWGLSQHMADEIKARCKLPLKPVNLDVSFKPGTGGNHD
nr:hypothetical protein [uncultured Pseudomonas sp.]